MNKVFQSPTPLLGCKNQYESPFIETDFLDTDSFSFKEVIDAIGKVGAGVGKTVGGLVSGGMEIASAAAPTLPSVLPSLGIGSKSRIAETKANADANTQVLNAQIESMRVAEIAANERANDQKQMLIIGGVFALLIVVVIVAIKR